MTTCSAARNAPDAVTTTPIALLWALPYLPEGESFVLAAAAFGFVFGEDRFLIVGEVAFEPGRLAVLHDEEMGADAVEEEAIVADDHGAAGEVDEALFENAHGAHVEVVGGLVEKEEVAAAT